ncbi:SMI1/KNR4 family protein [Endozoicomonas sp. SM1973]|uniref:SMI1/KNR4 family protein n=1 Tax=Spartinivicinus marinus TaxID=2994442 RepID=A0A853IF05_9GAMM|nr:SMI1/KNR4 family protein [Spartinivicinus marinus]MCX4029736.1 SMI1/KNR4 family protein [Spartinivicinus marinus]NYZ68067.1 SMI1/KNR4 family protein [Spartinivicinus marinus]
MADLILRYWQQILKWFKVNQPVFLDALNAGASQKQIEQLEAELGTSLPNDLRAFLLAVSGEKTDNFFHHLCTCGILPFHGDLFSVSEILNQRQYHLEHDIALNNSKDFQKMATVYQAHCPEVKPLNYDPLWIPIGGDPGFNIVFVDLNPTNQGTVGQVFEHCYEIAQRELLASSLTHYLKQYAEGLGKGRFYVEEDNHMLVVYDDHSI